MKVTIEFDLDNDQDRKHYNAWIRMKELTINLENVRNQILALNVECKHDLQWMLANLDHLHRYFDEMIWRKLG